MLRSINEKDGIKVLMDSINGVLSIATSSRQQPSNPASPSPARSEQAYGLYAQPGSQC